MRTPQDLDSGATAGQIEWANRLEQAIDADMDERRPAPKMPYTYTIPSAMEGASHPAVQRLITERYKRSESNQQGWSEVVFQFDTATPFIRFER